MVSLTERRLIQQVEHVLSRNSTLSLRCRAALTLTFAARLCPALPTLE